MVVSGWHLGEQLIQKKLGYNRAMEAMEGYKAISDYMPAQHRVFHTHQVEFMVLTTLDKHGRPWVSFLSGTPGFVTSPSETALHIQVDLIPGDPIAENIKFGSQLVSGLGIELVTRRRNKFGGKITLAAINNSRIEADLFVDQALGNCPKYINVRALKRITLSNTTIAYQNMAIESGSRLPDDIISMIQAADTVFLGTTFVSASPNTFPNHLGTNHRGGRAGFVRVLDGRTIVIPDYSGNRMMQSLGNIEITPLAGLSLCDFVSGDVIYITGNARNVVGDEARQLMPRINILTTIEVTGFVVTRNALPVRQQEGSVVEPSPYSPPIRFLAKEQSQFKGLPSHTTVTLSRISIHSDTIATFTFVLSTPLDIQPGQHVIVDLSTFTEKAAYQHMSHAGLEAVLNDDLIRTWTVSSNALHSTLSESIDITMRLKRHGTMTTKFFQIAHALAQKMPELLQDATPLNLSLGLLGISGKFVLPQKPQKMAWLAGGIGITPFLSMLGALMARTDEDTWDVVLLVATREPQVIYDLIKDKLGDFPPRRPKFKFDVHFFTSSPAPAWGGVSWNSGRISSQSLASVQDISSRTVMICGPPAFENASVELLRQAGVTEQDIVREVFAY